MKGRITMIGDYDDDSDTYAVYVLASAKEVDASGLAEGDAVVMMKGAE